jgi:hypothetical protein
MTGFAHDIAGGQGNLITIVEKSPNYVPGVSGWAIFRNGDVEFNSGTFRGTVTAGTFAGTNFVINSAGEFFYSGVPALGNLTASITVPNTTGTDAFGNHWFGGLASYDQSSNSGIAISQFQMVFLRNIGAGTAWTTTTGIFQALSPGFGIELAGPGFWDFGGVPVLGGTVNADPADATGATAEGWHALTNLQSGWTGSGRVKLLIENKAAWVQANLTAGTLTNGTPAISVPAAAYRPASTQFLPVGTGSGTTSTNGPYLQLTTGGNFQVENLPTATTTVHLNAIYALD